MSQGPTGVKGDVGPMGVTGPTGAPGRVDLANNPDCTHCPLQVADGTWKTSMLYVREPTVLRVREFPVHAVGVRPDAGIQVILNVYSYVDAFFVGVLEITCVDLHPPGCVLMLGAEFDYGSVPQAPHAWIVELSGKRLRLLNAMSSRLSPYPPYCKIVLFTNQLRS